METPETQKESEIIISKTKENTFIFECDTRYTVKKFKIDDEYIVSKGYSNDRFTLANEPKKIQEVEEIKFVSGYFNVENESEIMSLEQYDKERLKLLEGVTYSNDGEGRTIYPSLECEFAVRLFGRKWQPINKTKIILIDRSFIIQNLLYSEYPEIKLSRTVGEVPINSVHAEYSSRLVSWAEEICKKFGIKVLEEGDAIPKDGTHYWENSTHSAIHFAKIDGDYFLTSKGKKYEKDRYFSDSYAQCVAARNSDYNEVEEEIRKFLVLKQQKRLDASERQGIFKELTTIRENVYNLDVKTKSDREHRLVLTKIDNLIKTLTIK